MAKVELDLLNEFWKRTEREQEWRRYNAPVRTARPFSLDNATVEIVAEMASSENRHKMIPIYRQMARAPFKNVWIELDYQFLHRWRIRNKTTANIYSEGGIDSETQREISGSDQLDTMRATFGAPDRIGWLIDRMDSDEASFRVTTLGWMDPAYLLQHETDHQLKASMFPLVQFFTTDAIKKPKLFVSHENTMKRYQYGGRLQRELMDMNTDSICNAILWGMDRNTSKPDWSKSPMFGTNGFEPEPMFLDHMARRNADREDGFIAKVHSTIFSCAMEMKGDLRFIVAALALLNHVPVVMKPYRPKGHVIIKGGNRPYLSSSIVTIEVPNVRRRVKEIDRSLKQAYADYTRKRRHSVRGHWRYADKQHNGRWQRAIDPITMRPRWRIWITDHERGDGSLGFVQQYYSVEGNRHAGH